MLSPHSLQDCCELDIIIPVIVEKWTQKQGVRASAPDSTFLQRSQWTRTGSGPHVGSGFSPPSLGSLSVIADQRPGQGPR